LITTVNKEPSIQS